MTGVLYLFGMARNNRLVKRIARELKKARRRYYEKRQAQRIYKEFTYRTLDSWSRRRRVIGKAEYLGKGENPRFVVTNLGRDEIAAQQLYEQMYCVRGDMENRIKEQQLYLFADRTSSATMRANQLRLYFSSLAYVLLKIGAQVRISVRRVSVSFASSYPYQGVFFQIVANLKKAYPQLC